MIKPADARLVYYILSFTSSMLFSMIFMVTSIYEATIANLAGYQLVLIGTALEVSILLFEIPTGVLADTRSRKLSIILGLFLIGTGFLIEGLLPAFLPILLAQVVAGLGFTFTSGATIAWISDEIGEQEANQVVLNSNKFDQMGGLVGLAIATAIGYSNAVIPLVSGSVLLMLFSLSLVWLMPENGFSSTKPEDRNTWQHALAIFREGLNTIKINPKLLTILSVGFVYGLYSEGWDRLWVKHLLTTFDISVLTGLSAVGFIGILRAIAILGSILVTSMVERRANVNNPSAVTSTLFTATSILAISILLFAFSPWLSLSALLFMAVSASRNIIGPFYNAWINSKLPPNVRATILSMSGQVDAIGQVGSGPIAAAISLLSIKVAIAFAGLLLSPALPLIKRARPVDQPDL